MSSPSPQQPIETTTKKSPLKTSASLTTTTSTPMSMSTLQPNVMASKNKHNSSKRKKQSNNTTTKDLLTFSVLEAADVFQYSSELLLYNDGGGKELLRAGSIDALIVLATQSYKNDFLFLEAFVAMYRTFLSTHTLLEKLVNRFRRFNRRSEAQPDKQQQNKRVAHCAFSLLVG